MKYEHLVKYDLPKSNETRRNDGMVSKTISANKSEPNILFVYIPYVLFLRARLKSLKD